MKIAYVCPFYTPAIGGVKQVVEELAKRYIKQGHEVHVYCSDWDKEKRIKIKNEIIDGVHVHRCFHILRVVNFSTVWPSVFWRLYKKDFDIIHTHVAGHPHVFLAHLVGKLKKTPIVHTTHCPWTDAFRSLLGRILVPLSYNSITNLSFKWSNVITAITPWEISFITKYGGYKEKIIIIPNGMEKILYIKIKPNNFKKKLGIKGKLVLFFGRLNPTKGPEKLAQAAIEITKKRKDISFVWVGPDEGKAEEVKNMIKNYKNMFYLGPLRDKKKIAEMYQAADVYVLPSYREGLPLTLFEAMASGLPIVASPVNGIPYEMNEPENGFFVKYGDIFNLKRNILKILDNPKLAEKISQKNLKKAEGYDWDSISSKYMGVYIQCLKKY